MGGYMPEQNIVVEVAKDSWSWGKYVLGIVATIVSAVIVERFIRRKK